ncbi:hypothetical protein VN12_16280 [Pirellula sp. SH-Sr6A]|uniref:hypothetical protein n=1 Tax=Pirellula sp. SH-Sr6A TaxID=1632865 RepID=UPI00078E9190|nr:hypothetical protein [Pirellula sp. SH-Sr6A]AMV33687.1 hypothetical protein VN12_16280 [Pirellula sp. SH-Sr6A]
MKRRNVGCLITLGAILFVFAGFWMVPSRARRSLPWNATDIHEFYEAARFGSDFKRCLKAKMEERDFDAYATRLMLTEIYDPGRHADLGIHWGHCEESWWDPPESLAGVRFESSKGEEYFAIADWQEGYVYFYVLSW